ncbi:hypothetical protein LTR86_010201 [Recurvomyces mirabilis]|nr:hypothetical protein LTR86_010201 [Recurvomyces mirabilis]
MTSLSTKLAEREAACKPIRVGLIGAAGIADLSADRAVAALKKTGFPEDAYDTTGSMSIEEGIKAGKTAITTDSAALIASPSVDVILEVTGSPAAGIRHTLLCCEHKKHIVMINVEADVLAGPLLARKAREAGIIYSMAYGDQPALIAELVDWARTAGFDVVCAGKGTKHLPAYHASTPDTVWDYYGFTKEQLATGDFNPQMFNSFLDGTKSALEMAAVANGCDLTPPDDGLLFPPCGRHDLPGTLRPKADGGLLDKKGTVEVVSCLEVDGRPVHNDLRWGVYVIIEAPGEYQKECFKQYGLQTDSTGKYAAQYKPFHLIGLELGVSIANIMCRGEPTGQTRTWAGDVVATAKRDLKAGEKLDGEGGFMVYGKLLPAEASMKIEGLPIGLAHGLVLKVDKKQGQGLSWRDVEYSEKNQAVAVRREMEAVFTKEFAAKKGANGTNGVH